MNPLQHWNQLESRRRFFSRGKDVLGHAALAALLGEAFAKQTQAAGSTTHTPAPQFMPKAKRVIYLHMVGGPSQMDLFDYKPALVKLAGKQMPKAEGTVGEIATFSAARAFRAWSAAAR